MDDIQKALNGLPPPLPKHKRYVILGKAAMRAVRIDTVDHCKPQWINSAAVVETEDFDGWEIVDRPIVKRLGLA